ncbi:MULTISPECIES: ribosome biogenesis protein NOP53-like [Pseudomonas]|uniref:hypothetical protein n=1 Tax=Pseudomonas TaxID=286 RepID=UPI001C658E05|nr:MULTISPECIES: hypothetical protein [unclassified Pseudomonas]MBW8127780.1 hypothetical protein [Pseudomonas sp. LAP_36]MBW8137485.1 hypothetical protein [Pseudomonas sp. PAMC 26818]
MSGQKNDQIFQLSLTELAFMISFLLMLILGMMVFKTAKENESLRASIESSGDAQRQMDMLTQITQTLKSQLQAVGVKKPEDTITKLILAAEAKAETERLKVLLEEKNKEVTALMEIDKALAEMSDEKKKDQAKEVLRQAMLTLADLKKALQNQQDESTGTLSNEAIIAKVRELQQTKQRLAGFLNVKVSDLDESKIEKLVSDAIAYGEFQKKDVNPVQLKKENSDLQGQIAFLQHKLDARGGMDYPPCWADPVSGKIQMLFFVELNDTGLVSSPDWPESRQQDAVDLPGIQSILTKQTYGYEEFLQAVRPIFDMSKAKGCRFYVRMKNNVTTGVESDRKRRSIENFFYKQEMRR